MISLNHASIKVNFVLQNKITVSFVKFSNIFTKKLIRRIMFDQQHIESGAILNKKLLAVGFKHLEILNMISGRTILK